ncbi:uncharacterized protein PHALS_13251 [Plasmopara halstedii]|uniref:Uncharacterized protein n=1 Tax=Plasmopara halstedii TaxID=4781 RepID=A0A0P1AP15_PLAHL|nr:uncharacterized protein PHALS_13251 [Plasmopara halstedii]CEG43026.1 hypothetical protein PHALS_13251 [Plasmopara halstedii]|eukprot:XP_024579395.1 hypothetical protein PHALS_13251 [Plasmopara halstedii]
MVYTSSFSGYSCQGDKSNLFFPCDATRLLPTFQKRVWPKVFAEANLVRVLQLGAD